MNSKLLILFLGLSYCLQAQFYGSGHALEYNGLTDYVEIPNTASLNPGNAFTVEAWINADTWQPSSWQGTIVSKDGWSSVSEGWVIRCGGGGVVSFNLALNNNSSWYEITSAALMTTGKWYHVAGTYDGTTMKLYLNGTQVGTLNQSGVITSTNFPVKIGNISMPANSRFFDGKIDEVRLWNEALTEATLRKYMCQRIDPTHPNFLKLISHYNHDLISGSTLTDNSGNNNSGTRFGTAVVTSGAPLGSESKFLYTSSWTGQSVKLSHMNGDSVIVSAVTGNPQAIHLYRIDNHPNYYNQPPGVNSFYDNRFWGVYPVSGTNVKFLYTYKYQGYPILNQKDLNLNYRTDNTDSTWAGIVSTIDTIQKTMVKTLADQGEYIMGRNDSFKPFSLISPTSPSTINIQGLSTQNMNFTWHASQLLGGSKGNHEWQLDFDTANFSTPLKFKASPNGGKDTVVGVSQQEIANLMTANNLFYGDSLVGKWTVKATAGSVSKYAAVPFLVTFKREILTTDVIFGFLINEPQNYDTIVVYNGGTKLNNFNWNRGKSTAGNKLNYKVEFAGNSGLLSNPVGTFSSDNNGLDTNANISDADIATMLQNAGLGNDQMFLFKWRTKASLSTLSANSIDSQYVYLVRKNDPTIGIEKMSGNEIRMYPNPAKDVLYFESSNIMVNELNIELLDLKGMLVYSAKYPGQQKFSIQLPNLESGLYFIRLYNDKFSQSEKLLIE